MPDDTSEPDCTVTRVKVINGHTAYVFYEVPGDGRYQTKVYRDTWATHPGYWPPGVGDVFDPEYGTLKMRPRKDSP